MLISVVISWLRGVVSSDSCSSIVLENLTPGENVDDTTAFGAININKERHGKPMYSPDERSRGARDTNKKRGAGPQKNGGAHPGPAVVFFGGPAPLFLFVSRAPRERSLGLYIGLPCLSGVAVSRLTQNKGGIERSLIGNLFVRGDRIGWRKELG